MHYTSQARMHRRIPVDSQAWIEGAKGQLIPCSVVNLTAAGAQLYLQKPLVLPSHFSLLLTKDGTDKHSCRVIWSKAERLGVRFLEH
jgi:hypothetical protein